MGDGSLSSGRQIGNYCIVAELASGGFGSVYRGRHAIFTERPVVAIKLLHTHLVSEREHQQFIQEARLLERLQHAYILPIIDAGVHEGFPYLVTAYAPRGSLRAYVKRLGGQPLPLEEALTILTQVGAALQFAHEQSVIHRDLKPENILFNADNDALLADFGIAMILESGSVRSANTSGTPAYMAPEQFRGIVSKQSDQYALGCIAYELLTGRKPFVDRDPLVLMVKHTTELPPPPGDLNPHLPPHVEEAILTALAKSRADRYPDIATFIAALDTSDGQMYPAEGAANPGPAIEPTVGTGRIAGTEHTWGTEHHSSGIERAGRTGRTGRPQGTPVHITPRATHAFDDILPAPSGGLIEEDEHGTDAITYSTEPDIIQLPASRSRPPGTLPTRRLPPVPDTARSASTLPASRRAAMPRSRPGGQPSTDLEQDITTGHNRGYPVPSRPPLSAPSRTAPGSTRVAPRARVRRPALLMVGLLALVLVVLLVGSLVKVLAPQPTTVTITPATVALANSYTLTAVTGTPDPAQRQVQARLLSTKSAAQSQTVNATGIAQIPAIQAQGVLTFFNGRAIVQTILAGTTIKGSDGVVVTVDVNVDIPVGNPPNLGQITVSAHAVKPGVKGNIVPLDINQQCCSTDHTIFVKNVGAFTSGQDAQSYKFVQQSDIDGAVSQLASRLTSGAQNVFNTSIHINEKLVSTPRCTPKVGSDNNAGDHAATVTVTVTAVCRGEVYDWGAARVLVEGLLRGEAARNPGAGYAQVGGLSSSVAQAAPVDGQGTISLLVNAKGLWAYAFSGARLQDLKYLVAGKSQDAASALLARQTGIQAATIQIAGGDGRTLPADVGQIVIVVRAP
ncbi:MAG: protein kinase [Ktedonobacteraceae bacterium]|nr:protein kinase [Ktedonobacteraceae bacterium]